jgi:phospholipase C
VSDSPIKHLIVLMLENRSFDHMLGYAKIDGLENIVNRPSSVQPYSNKDKNGKEWGTNQDAEPSGLTDPGHDFEDVCTQLYGSYGHEKDCDATNAMATDPLMQGFIRSYADYDDSNPEYVMRCFDPACVSVLTTLAANYAACDHWFSSIPGPTLPNRLFAHAGTSSGRLDLSAEELGTPPTIYEVLNNANVASTIYAGGWTAAATFWNLMRYQDQYFGTLDDFYQDCYDDNLPGYSFIEPRYSPGMVDGTFRPQNDQHPDSDIAEGEQLIFGVYQAIRGNRKVWNSSMLVIVYDEHGGIYDHVPPPPAIPPGDRPSEDPHFNFDRYGVRVPAVIVSAYTDHVVCKDVFDHTSLISTARKVLTGTYRDGLLCQRALHANTFDTDTILNRRNPRTDHVSILVPSCKPNPQKPYCLNHLQITHLKQALCVNQKLPKSLQVSPGPSLMGLGLDCPDSDFCKINPVDAEHYAQSVFTTVRHLGAKFREQLENPCSVSSSSSR